MAFENLKESFSNVADRIEDYGLSTVEYYKLRLFKSAMKGSISLVNLLVYGSLSLFVMLFISIGGALWLGTFFENIFVGFFLIGGVYGIILIFMFVFGRKIIERKMLYSFSGLMYDEDDPDPSYLVEREIQEFEDSLKKEALRKEILKK